jgi:hypothetical protein
VSVPGASSSREDHVRDFARACVRSGLLSEPDLYGEVRAAVADELPELDPDTTAKEWVAQFRAELERDQRTWPETTDYDRLQAVFADLEAKGVVVLQGCDDHWAAKRAIQGMPAPPPGIAWFTQPDVWHAIDAGMLEVNVWHGTMANIAPGDALLDEVVAAFARQGLEAHFDEGRVEVSAHWQRRLA